MKYATADGNGPGEPVSRAHAKLAQSNVDYNYRTKQLETAFWQSAANEFRKTMQIMTMEEQLNWACGMAFEVGMLSEGVNALQAGMLSLDRYPETEEDSGYLYALSDVEDLIEKHLKGE